MSDDQDFLKGLFMELDRKVEASHSRLETKVDGLRESVDGKLDSLEVQVTEHEKKLERHEHTFTLVGSCFAGIPVLAGIATWVMSWFPNTPHK